MHSWKPTKDQKALIPEHNAPWIAKALLTERIDVEKTKQALDGLCGAAIATAVPTAYVSSMLVGTIVEASLIASGKGDANLDEALDATGNAAYVATLDATDVATHDATAAATSDATYGAADVATADATEDAIADVL